MVVKVWGSILGTFSAPKSTKNRCQKRLPKRPQFLIDFGSMLGGLGDEKTAFRIRLSIIFKIPPFRFQPHFFIHFGLDFRSIVASIFVIKASKKEDPKKNQKKTKKMTAQDSTRGIDRLHWWPGWPTGGVGGASTNQLKDLYLRSDTPMGSLRYARRIIYV